MKKIYNIYKELFYEMYSIKPVINYGQCGKLITALLKEYSEDVICKVVELYFLEEDPKRVFHLPSILSAYSINKYLPRIKQIGKSIYDNA